MRVGSLVECINDISRNPPEVMKKYGLKNIHKGRIYTIRGLFINEVGVPSCYLEEVINPIIPNKYGTIREVGYRREKFREVQPPMDLSFIEEIQQELFLPTNEIKILQERFVPLEELNKHKN